MSNASIEQVNARLDGLTIAEPISTELAQPAPDAPGTDIAPIVESTALDSLARRLTALETAQERATRATYDRFVVFLLGAMSSAVLILILHWLNQ